jgi:hypothetical protein
VGLPTLATTDARQSYHPPVANLDPDLEATGAAAAADQTQTQAVKSESDDDSAPAGSRKRVADADDDRKPPFGCFCLRWFGCWSRS